MTDAIEETPAKVEEPVDGPKPEEEKAQNEEAVENQNAPVEEAASTEQDTKKEVRRRCVLDPCADGAPYVERYISQNTCWRNEHSRNGRG